MSVIAMSLTRMSKGLERSSEVVRSAAAFHADQTRRQIRKEAVELRGFVSVVQEGLIGSWQAISKCSLPWANGRPIQASKAG
jgi:hypothetical protein